MMMKSGIFFIFFEIPLANLPGQFNISGLIVLHWAAATLKGLVEFQNKKLFIIIFKPKMLVLRPEILVRLF
jgi:hypothetical protein